MLKIKLHLPLNLLVTLLRSQERLNKSLAERVAIKIGMITTRATKVVACAFTYMAIPRSARKWHSRASPE
jgi:hypothetical protein